MPNPFCSCLRASCVYCPDINTEGTVFAERRALLQGSQVRRQEAKLRSLSPSVILSPISELGEEFVMRMCWQAGFGKWPFVVRCGNGVSAPDLLKGFRALVQGHVRYFGSVRETSVLGLV